MGRRRKRRKKIRRRGPRLPARYFQCPVCGSPTLTIDFVKSKESRNEKIAVARCGTCVLHCVFRVPASLERIDVYNMIVDLAYENRLDECRPKEGELEELAQTEEVEGETVEEEGAPVPAGEDEHW